MRSTTSEASILSWEGGGPYTVKYLFETHIWWDSKARRLRHYRISYEYGRFVPRRATLEEEAHR